LVVEVRGVIEIGVGWRGVFRDAWVWVSSEYEGCIDRILFGLGTSESLDFDGEVDVGVGVGNTEW
jgi:hypothetical protein